MNDRFGSFDLDSFGLGFDASTSSTVAASTSQQQQQQHHQNLYHSMNGGGSNSNNSNRINNNGPLMDGYDPSILLGGGAGISTNGSVGASLSYSTNNNSISGQQQQHSYHGGNHHQTLLPSTAGTTTTTTTTTTLVGYAMAPSSQRRLGTSTIATTAAAVTGGGNSNHNNNHIAGNSTSLNGSNLGGPFSEFDGFDFIPLPKNAIRRQHHPSLQQQTQQQQQQPRHHHRHNTTSTTAGSSSSSVSGTNASMAALASIQQQQQRSLSHSNRHVASSAQQHTAAGVGLVDLYGPPSYCGSSGSITASASLTNNNYSGGSNRNRSKANNLPVEPWLEELQVTVSGLSLEPLSGTEIVKRLDERTAEVLSRYLPCVSFLVECQQDLRKGLAAATTQRFVHHMFRDAMTPRQFHNTYISNLPERFYRTNKRVMGTSNLDGAVKELQKLCANARAAEGQGSEAVKNTFLGGMKDGESWGLRKWLAKHGGALQICNDTECILNSCQKLDRSSQSTVKLAARLRPMAKAALDKLKADVPASYQEQSSAHPYLPFFHRLEAALRGVTNFDPEDDDVICIDDDDEVEELKALKKAVQLLPAGPKNNPPKKVVDDADIGGRGKRKAASMSKSSDDDDDDDDDDDSDSEVEVLDGKPFARASSSNRSRSDNNSTDSSVGGVAMAAALNGDDSDYMKALLRTFDVDDDDDVNIDFDELEQTNNLFANSATAYHLAAAVNHLVALFESNQHNLLRPQYIEVSDSFWDEAPRYAEALRLLSHMIQVPESASMFLERVNEVELVHEGKIPYGSIIKHPLCFRDIVGALIEDFNVDTSNVVSNTGTLPVASLSSWNMWRGSDLLQAIDLIFLNALAYGKANDQSNKSNDRSKTNRLRKELWAGIKDVIDFNAASDIESRRRCTPTRRGESSGFVVRKGAI